MADNSKESEKISGFSRSEWDRRYQKIRELMQFRDIDCLIITGHEGRNGAWQCNVQYTCGMNVMSTYVVLPLEGEIIAISSMPTMGGPVPFRKLSFKKGKGEARRVRDYCEALVSRIKELDMEKATIGIVDMRVMPAGIYMELLKELPQANFVPAGDILLEARRIKSPEEQEYVIKAGEIADKGAEAMIEAALKPGVTQDELRKVCRIGMLEAGALNVNFAFISIASWSEIENSMFNFSGPDQKLKKGDLILNEIEPNHEGYFIQACYPIHVGGGDLPESFKDLFKLHKDIYDMANEEIRPGKTVIEIERMAAKMASSKIEIERAWTLEAAEVEEDFNKATYAEIRAGMCYVNHPWIEAPKGKPGHRGHLLGNTIIVTDDKPIITSRFPTELTII